MSPRRRAGSRSVTAAGISMPGGIQPLARSVTNTVVSSARSPTAQASRGCWLATAATIRCNRLRAVASADTAPATAPPAEAMAPSVPTPGGDCAGVGGAGWRTRAAGWPTPGAPPDEGCPAAELDTGDVGGDPLIDVAAAEDAE